MTSRDTRPLPLALGGLVAMATALGIGRFVYTPILPAMVEGLGLTQGEAGLIASANFVGYLVGALAAASPRLPLPPRAMLVLALAVSAATTAAMALPSAIPAFIALRLIGGAASAFVLVLASALVLERLSAAGAARFAPIHFAGVGAGIAVSAVLIPLVAMAGLGWRAMWTAGGAISGLGLLIVLALVPGATPRTTAPAAAAGSAIAAPGFQRLAVAYGLLGFGYVVTATFIVAIVREHAATRAIEPAFWLVLGLAAVPSVALWVAVGRRIGILKAYAVASLVEAVGVAASVLHPSVAGLMLAALLLGATFMGMTALGLMAARAMSTGDARRPLAMMTAAFGVGQIVGPVVAGYGRDLTGSFLLPTLIAAACLVAGAALTAYLRIETGKA